MQCSPSNTGLQFTTYDDGGFYFRTAPPDNLQAQVLTDLITGDGKTKVTIVARSDEYGEGFANALKDELEAAGATVTPADPILYDPEAGNYQAEAQQIADAAPDAVAMIAFDEGGQVVQAAIAAGVGPRRGAVVRHRRHPEQHVLREGRPRPTRRSSQGIKRHGAVRGAGRR